MEKSVLAGRRVIELGTMLAAPFADHILSQAPGLRNAIVEGSASVLALADDQF